MTTCARSIFARGNGTSQGCECKTAGQKCTTCACKAKCINLHHAPTPRSNTPSGITSFFNRNATEGEPEPEVPEPEPEQPEPESNNTIDNYLQTPEENTTNDVPDDDDYLTATQNSAESDEEDVGDTEATDEAESNGVGDESEEERGEEQEPEAATTVDPDNDDDEAEGSDTEADDVMDTFLPEEGANLPNYNATPTDEMLNILYHLDRGIENDARWQCYWKRVVSTKSIWYQNQQGQIGKLFIYRLIEIIHGMRE